MDEPLAAVFDFEAVKVLMGLKLGAVSFGAELLMPLRIVESGLAQPSGVHLLKARVEEQMVVVSVAAGPVDVPSTVESAIALAFAA